MIVVKETLSLQQLFEISPQITKLQEEVLLFVSHEIFELVEYMYFKFPSIRIAINSESIRNALDLESITYVGIDSFNVNKESYKQSFFVSHWGIGDMINLNGAINFLSQDVDEIYVICYKAKKNIALQLYESNMKIRPLIIESEESISPGGQIPPRDIFCITVLFDMLISYFKICHASGLMNPNSIIWKEDWAKLPPPPWLFYEDLNLPHDIKYKYQILPKTKNAVTLQNLLVGHTYIFVHQKCSVSEFSLVDWDIQTVLTINPDSNLYKKEEPFYKLAQEFVGQNIFDYIPIIQNAKELYMIDSSFSCLALYCKPLKAEKKHCYKRDSKEELIGWYDTP
jgi:hypothetical protein